MWTYTHKGVQSGGLVEANGIGIAAFDSILLQCRANSGFASKLLEIRKSSLLLIQSNNYCNIIAAQL